MWKLRVVMWPRMNFGYAMFMPMLKVIHTFIKYIQCWDVFIINFVDVMNLVNVKLSYLYIDPIFNFDDLTFDNFTKLSSQFLWCFAFLLVFKSCWPSKVSFFLKIIWYIYFIHIHSLIDGFWIKVDQDTFKMFVVKWRIHVLKQPNP